MTLPTQPVRPCPEMIAQMGRRRSSKPFHLAEPAPDQAQLAQILTLAARTPDHGKLTPWRFLVIAGEARARIGEGLAAIMAAEPGASAETIAAARAMLLRSPLIVGVVSTAAPHAKIPLWEQELSAGAVCMNLLHAADALGFGAVWLTGWSIYDDRARPLYGLKEGERIAGLIYLGAQTEAQEDRPRPALSSLVTVL